MTSMFLKSIKKILVISIFFLAASLSFSERLGLEGYQDLAFDFPEGFYVEDMTSDGKGVLLKNKDFPLTAIIRIYNYKRFGSNQKCMDDTLSKLSLKGTSSTVDWRNQKSSLAKISGKMSGKEISGYAATFTLPFDKGNLFLATWCEKNNAQKYDDFLTSLLDAVFIDAGSYYESGLYTSYKYPKFERGEKKKVTLTIGGKEIESYIHENDAKINQALVEREFKVLEACSSKATWKEAWQRYYRMIFKDCYSPLRKCAFDIYNSLAPDCSDETDLAQKLLSWTQEMHYEREKTYSDFISPLAIVQGSGSDCDSRSMLLAVLLTHMNQDALIFVSATYSHAMAGFVSSHPGHSFSVNGKKYLMGETTAKGLTWGKISADEDNQSEWIEVQFP